MKNCDLHTHSNYSDGYDKPKKIIKKAKKLSVAVALTDHNTVKGIPEFLKYAKKYGVKAVGGVEISTDYKGKEFHLLGLFVVPEYYEQIERWVEPFRALKEQSNIEMSERLNAAGMKIKYKSVVRRSKDGNVNRVQFAEELVAKGYVGSINDAFRTLLKEGNGIYIPAKKPDLIDAVKFLRDIKAVPVLAHPLKGHSVEFVKEVVSVAKSAGLVGMEIYHSDYNEEQIKIASDIAEEFGLLPSGGSDYHGKKKPDIKMVTGKGNLSVPISFYENLYKMSLTL